MGSDTASNLCDANIADSGLTNIFSLNFGRVGIRVPFYVLLVANLTMFGYLMFSFGHTTGSPSVNGMTDIEQINYHQTEINKIKARYER